MEKEKIYLPKKHYELFKGMSNSALLFSWKEWQSTHNTNSKEYELMQVISTRTSEWLVDAIVKIIKGEIEVLQEKEAKYRLYYRQNCTPWEFEYHYIDKNATLTETDNFAKITTFTKEEAYELIDDLGEWIEEWLHEAEE